MTSSEASQSGVTTVSSKNLGTAEQGLILTFIPKYMSYGQVNLSPLLCFAGRMSATHCNH